MLCLSREPAALTESVGTGAGWEVTVSPRQLWRQEGWIRLLHMGWVGVMQHVGRRLPKTMQQQQVGHCVCGLADYGGHNRQAVSVPQCSLQWLL